MRMQHYAQSTLVEASMSKREHTKEMASRFICINIIFCTMYSLALSVYLVIIIAHSRWVRWPRW